MNEPTEMAGVAEADTESAYAWALDYDDADEFPTTRIRRMTPRRVTTLALAGSLLLTAGTGIVALWASQPIATVPPAAVVETTTTTMPPAPPPPPPVTVTITPPPPPVTVTTTMQAPEVIQTWTVVPPGVPPGEKGVGWPCGPNGATGQNEAGNLLCVNGVWVRTGY